MEVSGRLNLPDILEGAMSNYMRAVDTAGNVPTDDYLIGGSLLSLRFASPALRERLTPAFAHLVAPSNSRFEHRSFTVNLWDSASTGVEPPPLPPAPAGRALGELYHFQEPPLRAAYQPGLRTLSIVDSNARTAWHWVGSAVDQSAREQACPIRQILFWWLGSNDYLQIHGAAVGTRAGGVLLVGQPGSGKSTVALACLGSALLYAGDDYVATTVNPRPRVASLYNSAKVEPEHMRQGLAHLRPLLASPDLFDEKKAVVYVHERFPYNTTSGFGLEAVILPRFDPSRRKARVVEVSRASAFAALGPSTIIQLHTAGREELARLSSLVASLPCFALEFGSDLSTIPATLTALLSGSRAV
jgi:hypothetical protein